jgi:hypothetical protein
MKNNIISCVLVASLSFSIGCYNTQTITREQLTEPTKEELKAKTAQVDITVCTSDSLEYKFLKDSYRIQADTLTGFGVQTIGGTDRRFQGSISFADISSLKTEEFDLTGTIIAIGLPVGLVVGFLFWFGYEMSKI